MTEKQRAMAGKMKGSAFSGPLGLLLAIVIAFLVGLFIWFLFNFFSGNMWDSFLRMLLGVFPVPE